MAKTAKQLERYFKGVSCHRRIQMLRLIAESKGMTLLELSETLKTNIKTTSEHTARLVKAGLVNKNYRGNFVIHTLSPYGEKMIKVFTEFE